MPGTRLPCAGQIHDAEAEGASAFEGDRRAVPKQGFTAEDAAVNLMVSPRPFAVLLEQVWAFWLRSTARTPSPLLAGQLSQRLP